MSSRKGSRRRARMTAVDVHCHVFNAQDIPIRKFIELVYLEKIPGGSLLNPLIDLLELIMRSGAPTTSEEIKQLKHAKLRRRRLKTPDDRAHDIRIVSRALELMWYRSPRDRRWVKRHLRPRVRRRFKGKRIYSLSSTEFRDTARYLRGLADIGTWIDFALIYTRPRWKITEKLVSLSKIQAKDVILYTPLMLDIGVPLGEGDTSDLAGQVEVMKLISKIPRPCAVHPFVAFDPFRAKYDANILPTVKDAIRNNGAIGVKIYPPMGFRPSGNADPAIEQQMKRLVDFCLLEDVPILAHCSFSQFVTAAQGACAAPEAWKTFLQQPGHKDLRLDLGHCGGPWDFGANAVTHTIWTDTVITLLGSNYPHLYADVSDDSWILDPFGPDNYKLMTKLLGFLNQHPKARRKLLYGSDWSLLARESGANGYYPAMKNYFGKLLNFSDAEQRGYLGGNALCFLGLVKDKNGSEPKNRQRLYKFRRKNGLDMSIFSKIDALKLVC